MTAVHKNASAIVHDSMHHGSERGTGRVVDGRGEDDPFRWTVRPDMGIRVRPNEFGFLVCEVIPAGVSLVSVP
jgi:hypothetical protein